MSATKYTFTISTAFPNAKVATDRLALEIAASSITIALDRIETAEDACDIWFKDEITGANMTALDALVAAHSGEPIPAAAQAVVLKTAAGKDLASTSRGLQRVAMEKPDTSSVTFYSHDWTDPTTWTQDAERVVDETPIRIDGNRYRLLHENVIDTYHGKVTSEDYARDANGHTYRVAVTVDGAAKTEVDPHTLVGDYVVGYESGMLHFSTPVDVSAEVRVTYHHARSSTFTIKPAPGTVLSLALVECQFSVDVSMTDSVTFQPYGYAGAFAPQLGLPPTTLIPLGDPVVYKSMSDFQNDANRAYPAYPALGGSSWRGMNQAVVVFNWDYLRAKPLYSSAGMEIRVKCQHDTPFGGYYATATFYCTTEAES